MNIIEKNIDKIRELCKDLDGLSQENFDKGIKLFAADKAESRTCQMIDVISKKEYERLSKNSEYTQAAEVITDTLDAMSGELEVKAQNVVMYARNLQATATAIKDAEEQMAKRRKAIENRAKHLLDYVQGCMETAEVQKIECPYFRCCSSLSHPG